MDIKQYKFKTELHAHTSPASQCSQIPPEDEVKTYAALGYDSIVISNHFGAYMPFADNKQKAIDFFLNDYDIAVKCGKKYGINVILGCEMRFRENINDYLLFGIDREFLYDAYDYVDKGIAEFSKFFRNENRVLLQAHPFRDGMSLADPQYLDGIETYNMHPGHNSRIAVAVKYANEHDFIVSAGTDYHHPGHEGLASLLSKTEIKDSFDLARVMRSRDYLLGINNNRILPYGE